VANDICRSAVPATKYLPQRRSTAFPHLYTPDKIKLSAQCRVGEEHDGHPGRVGDDIFELTDALEGRVAVATKYLCWFMHINTDGPQAAIYSMSMARPVRSRPNLG